MKTGKRDGEKTGLRTRLPVHPSSRLPRRQFLWTGLLFIPALTRAQFIPGPGYQAAILKPAAGGGAPCTTSKDSQTGVTNNHAPNNGYRWIGFNFVAGSSYTLCALRMRMSKAGTPTGNTSAAIYTNGASEPGTQVGTASDAVASSTLTTAEADFDLSNLSASLTNGTTYWIVVKSTTTGDGTNQIRVFYTFTGVAAQLVKLNDGLGGTWDSWTTDNQGKFTSFST